ncbi:hypothetical protein KCU62_g117, partial [Aureobasidium sp. EXF-3399]
MIVEDYSNSCEELPRFAIPSPMGSNSALHQHLSPCVSDDIKQLIFHPSMVFNVPPAKKSHSRHASDDGQQPFPARERTSALHQRHP